MLVVREVFKAKPGQAGKLAKLFKKAMPEFRVMTDLVGEFNTVVIESEAASLADWDKKMSEYSEGKIDPEVMEQLKHYTEMYMEGRREIFRITE